MKRGFSTMSATLHFQKFQTKEGKKDAIDREKLNGQGVALRHLA